MSRHFSLIGSSALLLIVAVSNAAGAQSFNDYLNKKYEIQQQQADSDRIKAEAERVRAQTEAKRAEMQASQLLSGSSTSSSGASSYTVPHNTDDFAGKNVPRYRLPNGVTLQASGEFHPNKGVRCTSDCFVPLRPPH
jgi:Tfp pilus assembly major pilin PilA